MTSRVIFIHPHISMELQYGTRYRWAGAVLPPLGILYIAAVLERAGHEVRVVDANARNMGIAEVVEQVKAFDPHVVGLTGTTLSFESNARIADAIKAWNPNLPIVMGGVHAQGAPETCLEVASIDYVIPGEGEYVMLEFVECLERGDDLTGVKGVVMRREGKVIDTGPGRLVENLDDLPFPARHLLHDMSVYHQKSIAYRVKPHTTMFTQRGCPFQCVFCSSSKQFRDVFNKRVRAHSVAYIREEIRHLQSNYGIKEIYFADDTFNLKQTRVTQICDMILEEFPGLKWSCNFEAKYFDDDVLKHMRKAGCWLVQMGVETGNAEIMKTIQKGIDLDEVRRAAAAAERTGMVVKASFILGNPGETRETIEETIRFAESLPVHYITFTMMAPLPGTYFWQNADEYGTFDRSSYDKFSMSNAAFVPFGLDADYLREKQIEGHKRVYLRLSMIKRHLKLIRSPADLIRYARGAMAVLI